MTAPSRRRLQLLSVLVALGCVVLATIGIRVSDPADDFQLVHGRLGHPVTINEGMVTVDNLRVARSLVGLNGDPTTTTPGMFVVVNVTATATGAEKIVLGSSQLSSGDRTYLPYSASTRIDVDPGFAETQDFVFEVDPTRITDLTLDLWQGEIVVGHYQRIRVPLGVSRSGADDLRARAEHATVEPDSNSSTKAIP